VRAAVQLQDAVVEILDTEAQARHPHVPDGLELGLAEGAGLAFERDLFGGLPGRHGGEPVDEPLQLPCRQK
jgi:hypothetical protein